ncbi:transposase [Candidatus Kaiserbacteria bacterium]|nr:transposase [Candidatus Kaiserbacteria bacterium]
MALAHSVSPRTITKRLDTVVVPEKVHVPRPIVAVMDVTFFGREYGVLIAREPNDHENLHVHELRHENKLEYQTARTDLETKGYELLAVILDGRKGIPAVFKDIPVQICQFHQWKIVRKYLTLRPKLESHKALLMIAGQIAKETEAGMRAMLEQFAVEYKGDLEEHVVCPCCNKPKYVHRKLRSAYRSLTTNLPFLYTYQKYPDLKISNTTNSADGLFSALKLHVNVHRGLRFDRRFKVIRAYLKL